MSVFQYFLAALPLGFAGFDPAPALIALAALAAQVRRRSVGIFGLSLLAGTAIWGLILSILLGDKLTHVHWGFVRSGAIPATVEFVVAAVLMYFFFIRIRRVPSAPATRNEKTPKKQKNTLSGLLITAFIFISIVIFDPAFPVFVALSGPQHFVVQIVGWIVWACLSQICLVLLLCALPFRFFASVSHTFQRFFAKFLPLLTPIITGCLAAGALICVLDAATYLLHGDYLIDFS